MKQRILFLFCAALLLICAACGAPQQPQSTETPEPTTVQPTETEAPSPRETAAPTVGMANPFVDCETPEDAAAVAGFSMQIPKGLRGYPERSIQAVSGSLIKVFYANGVIGEDTTDYVLLRKGLGPEEISGVYTVYSQEQALRVEGAEIIARGEGDLVYVADWQRDGYRYSLYATGGLSPENVTEIADAVQ